MSRIIGLLNEIKMISPQEILLSIYNTLILPHLNYCILSWGKYCEQITLLQKHAMRAVCYTKYNVHTEPLFKMCNVLNFNDLYDTKLLIYFVSIGGSVGNSQSNIMNDAFHTYLTDKPNCTLKFKLTNVTEIIDIMNKLKLKSNSGVDDLSTKVIKHIQEIIAGPLTIIINQMLNTGIFPDSLKISKVLPLFIKDNDKLFSNYRPISLLPSILKIFEKVIFNQMSEYFENNDLIFKNQYGFRKNHSTEFASLH